jgi:hypothetical protein
MYSFRILAQMLEAHTTDVLTAYRSQKKKKKKEIRPRSPQAPYGLHHPRCRECGYAGAAHERARDCSVTSHTFEGE